MRGVTITAGLMAFWAAPVSAQTLWQNVTVGMTLDEIRRAQPEASPPARPSTLYGGARCEVRRDNYEVASNLFDVCFYIRDGGLVQVTLSAKNPSGALFETVSELLRVRYGSEIAPQDDPCEYIGPLHTCDMDWFLPSGVNINLTYSDVGGDASLLNINYQTRVRDESERL